MRLATALLFIGLAGCAAQSPATTTYSTPAQGAPLSIAATQRTSTPIYVDVCEAGTWERAAVIGKGLVAVGSIIVTDSHSIASNQGARPLLDNASVVLAIGRNVKFRVRSNPEATGSGTAVSCTTVASVTPEPGASYKAVWRRVEGGCQMSVSELLAGTETILLPQKVDDACVR